MAPRPASVEFFFDLMCPWAHQGARWIREVRHRTGLEVDWRFFSLEEVNRQEGKKHPWEREWSYGWSQMRVAALLRRRGPHEVDRWYEVMGRAFHEEGVPTHDPAEHRRVLEEHGWDPAVLDEAVADPTTSEEVRADHERAASGYGAFGVPVIVYPEGDALFGPVVAPAPTGERAVALWDQALAMRDFPELYELKRPKTRDDLSGIAELFEPYLSARSWQTVQNPAP